ncbi:hypothetical protein P43SY_009635 [Pythium insidiosum]|uniref:Phosphodiesterase n=1 Tax=Pythium insidiosum TaxID=114742 RepID=A0AAD5M056_PYTIN|nr:hypothetical protein P43SY_009635 [Pythium insidiosum]
MTFFSLLLVAFCAALGTVQGQLPIPGKPPGFAYGKGSPGAGVQLETYIDLLCPDSKSAFPGLKKLAEHYEPDDKSAFPGLKKLAEHYEPDEFRLTFVLFPLPYHQHAFAAAESTYTITAALGDASFDTWLETLYANQDIFWNKATKDKSPVEVNDMFFALASKTFPSLTNAQWSEGMNGYGGTFADEAARVAWKYTCSRGKSGTPMYTLNGVPFDAEATWTFEDWFKVINPLVEANKPSPPAAASRVRDQALRLHRMPVVPDRRVVHFANAGDAVKLAAVCDYVRGGHRPCEFLPGRLTLAQSLLAGRPKAPSSLALSLSSFVGAFRLIEGLASTQDGCVRQHAACLGASSGAIAALSLLESKRRGMVIAYAAVEAAVALVKEHTALADIKHIDVAVGALACQRIIYLWIFGSENYSKTQLVTLDGLSNLPEEVLSRMRIDLPNNPAASRCDVFHRGLSCREFHSGLLQRSFSAAMRLYVPIYIISAVLPKYKRWISGPRPSVVALIAQYLRTCTSLTASYSIPLALSCALPIKNNRVTVTIVGLMTVLSLLIEHEKRRVSVLKAIAVYPITATARQLRDALQLSPRTSRLCQYLIFSVSMAVVFRRPEQQNGKMMYLLYGHDIRSKDPATDRQEKAMDPLAFAEAAELRASATPDQATTPAADEPVVADKVAALLWGDRAEHSSLLDYVRQHARNAIERVQSDDPHAAYIPLRSKSTEVRLFKVATLSVETPLEHQRCDFRGVTRVPASLDAVLELLASDDERESYWLALNTQRGLLFNSLFSSRRVSDDKVISGSSTDGSFPRWNQRYMATRLSKQSCLPPVVCCFSEYAGFLNPEAAQRKRSNGDVVPESNQAPEAQKPLRQAFVYRRSMDPQFFQTDELQAKLEKYGESCETLLLQDWLFEISETDESHICKVVLSCSAYLTGPPQLRHEFREFCANVLLNLRQVLQFGAEGGLSRVSVSIRRHFSGSFHLISSLTPTTSTTSAPVSEDEVLSSDEEDNNEDVVTVDDVNKLDDITASELSPEKEAEAAKRKPRVRSSTEDNTQSWRQPDPELPRLDGRASRTGKVRCGSLNLPSSTSREGIVLLTDIETLSLTGSFHRLSTASNTSTTSNYSSRDSVAMDRKTVARRSPPLPGLRRPVRSVSEGLATKSPAHPTVDYSDEDLANFKPQLSIASVQEARLELDLLAQQDAAPQRWFLRFECDQLERRYQLYHAETSQRAKQDALRFTDMLVSLLMTMGAIATLWDIQFVSYVAVAALAVLGAGGWLLRVPSYGLSQWHVPAVFVAAIVMLGRHVYSSEVQIRSKFLRMRQLLLANTQLSQHNAFMQRQLSSHVDAIGIESSTHQLEASQAVTSTLGESWMESVLRVLQDLKAQLECDGRDDMAREIDEVMHTLTSEPELFRPLLAVTTARHAGDASHGAFVVWDTNALLRRLQDRELTPLQLFSALLAACVHDVNHPGLNNGYLVNSNAPLAIKYSDDSVLERMHLAETFQACTKDGCDVFDGLSHDQRRQSRRLIIAMVLATDLSGHLKHVNKLKSKRFTMQTTRSALALGAVQQPDAADASRMVPDELILRTVIMMADLGHASKPFAQHLAWSQLVTEEFFRQGDIERQYGLQVSPLCDRFQCNFEKSQVGFLEFVVLPLYSAALSVLPLRMDDILERIRENLATWRSRGERVAKGLPPEIEEEETSSSAQDSNQREEERRPERKESRKIDGDDEAGVVILDEAELQQLLCPASSPDEKKVSRM